MNKQEQILSHYNNVEWIGEGIPVYSREQMLAAIVEAMGVQQEEKEFVYFPNHDDEDGRNSFTICYAAKDDEGEYDFDNCIIVATCDTEEDATESCKRLDSIIKAAPAKAVEAMPEKKGCTKPNCDCLEKAEQEAGGHVKSYQCLAGIKADLDALKSKPRQPVEAMDSLPAQKGMKWVKASEPPPEHEKVLVQFGDENRLIGIMDSNNQWSIYWQDGINSEDPERPIKYWMSLPKPVDESASSSNDDYVASNSNTDDTSLVSHSCTDGNSIEQ
jgi:hypothetical protein